MPITKKYVEIKIGDKVVAVLPICECSPLEFIQKQKEAAKNLSNLEKVIKLQKNRLSALEKEVRILKGEDEEKEEE